MPEPILVALDYRAARRPFVEAEPLVGAIDASPDEHVDYPRDGVAAAYLARSVRPVLGRALGLASAPGAPLDSRHVDYVARWCKAANARWLALPAGFTRVPHPRFARATPRRGIVHGKEVLDARSSLPLPSTEGAADALARRIAEIARAIPVPIVIQNAASLMPPCGELSSAAFLSRVASRAGVGIVLDVVALQAAARAERVDAAALLHEVDATRIVGLRVAGSEARGGGPPTSHARVDEATWALVDVALARTAPAAIILARSPETDAAGVRVDLARAHASARSRRARPSAHARAQEGVTP